MRCWTAAALVCALAIAVSVDARYSTAEGIHDGEAVPASAATVIEAPASRQYILKTIEFPSGNEVPRHHPRHREQRRKLHPWSAEDMNRQAIRRVSSDLPSLLKSVDDKLNVFRHHAVTDYHNDLPSNHRAGSEESEDSDEVSFVEVEMETFRRMPEVERLRMLKHKHTDFKTLRDTIALELAATSAITQRVMGKRVKKAATGPDAELERTLRATDQLVDNNPELKDWADDAKWRQSLSEINQLLSQSDNFLTHLSRRVKTDYML